MWLIKLIKHLLTRRKRQRAAIQEAAQAEQRREFQEAVIRRSRDAALRQAGVDGAPEWLTAPTGEHPTWPVRRG